MTPPPEDRLAEDRPARATRLHAVEPTAEPAATAAPAPLTRAARAARRRARLAAVPAGDAPAAPRAPNPEVAPAPLPAPVPLPAQFRPRHWGVLASFLLLVILPLTVSIWYLWDRAADQYHSDAAFSIRSSQASSGAAAGILGALTQIGSSGSTNSAIILEFIGSQTIVEEIDAEIGLRAIYRRATHDPVFALGSDPSIEALMREWGRMVQAADDGSGLIHVRANAFAPEDARTIAQAILAHSSTLVNRLSDQARDDAIRFARDELAETETNLRTARERIAAFRHDNGIVDPAADAAGQNGLLNALQTQLGQALVDRDVMLSYASEGDQRVVQINRRIDAINERIDAERNSLGIPGTAKTLPDLLNAFQELQVDLDFANKAYVEALSALAVARAEARRQTRYLAPHIQPTLAMTSLYPRRLLLAGLAALFLTIGWGIAMLIYYNVRDNR